MKCDAIAGTEKRANHPCVLPARWAAEVRHTLGVVHRRLCDRHMRDYREINLLKTYRPLVGVVVVS